MRLVFVFDYRNASGTLVPFRVPSFVARIVCRAYPFHDYAPMRNGY